MPPLQQALLGRLRSPRGTGPRGNPQVGAVPVRHGGVGTGECAHLGWVLGKVAQKERLTIEPLRTIDGVQRCWWPGDDAQYIDYHDTEWGRPVTDPVALFEKMCLEGFQSGLAWITILRKRANFREAFAGFDPVVVAGFGESDVARLLGDAGIVRHRGKIEAVINNARMMLAMRESGIELHDHVWSFAPDVPHGRTGTVADGQPIASVSPEATALSKDLKRRGWTYVGPTTMYSMMQSMGMVNDHVEGCSVRDECEALREAAMGRMSRGAR